MKAITQHAPAQRFFCLAYAGPRALGPAGAVGEAWTKQLAVALETVAEGVRARLPADRSLALVGSLAQGADLAIAETFLARGAVLCAWLPEPVDRFVEERDIPNPADRARVAALLADPGLVEMRVMSAASDRRERFAECAERVVRAGDAILCVRHFDAANGRGGTEESVALAAALKRPLIEVHLAADPGAAATVVFPPTWPLAPDAGTLPFPRPDPRKMVGEWKDAASREAGRTKLVIVRAAAWTVGLQLAATVFAVVTFEAPAWEVPSLLVKLAVILAVAGITISSTRRRLSSRWTARRFTAELQRSWWAVRGFPTSAQWLEEDLPVEFAGHGRDLALLHGLDRNAGGTEGHDAFRARYSRERIGGQRDYATNNARSAGRWTRILQGTFYVCLAATLVALLTKLGLHMAGRVADERTLDDVCTLVSILGPTLGAAAVSFVALLDLKARRETQTRLAEFLGLEERDLAACTDWASTRQVVAATERRLLGEIKTWHARHAYRK